MMHLAFFCSAIGAFHLSELEISRMLNAKGYAGCERFIDVLVGKVLELGAVMSDELTALVPLLPE